MNFDGIVASITDDEFTTSFLKGQFACIEGEEKEHPDDIDEIAKIKEKIKTHLSQIPEKTKKVTEQKSQDTLYNIAYFAKTISTMHPGWGQKGFETEEFKAEIEKLYREQEQLPVKKRLTGDALLTEFFRITAQTIQDNHLSITDIKGNYPFKNKQKTIDSWRPFKLNHPKGKVGKNSAYNPQQLIEEGGTVFSESFSKDGAEFPLIIAEREKNGKKTGIVAFSSCLAPHDSKKEWDSILQRFKALSPTWDKVIVDFRGNTGGDGFQTRELAETLYSGKVPYCLQSVKRKTKENQLREELSRPIPEQPLWDKKAHPFRGDDKKRIFVLTDKETGSAAEAIVPMLKNHPKVQFVGENTCGCCQYGGVRPVALPCGGRINLGSIYREYEDGMIECVGHKPDIRCEGMDAMQVALAPLPHVYVSSKKNTSQEEIIQPKTESKTSIFPSWMKNPSWLWQGKKQK